MLRGLARQTRIPHALFFLGDYGGANLGLALAYARFVLCQTEGQEEPCENCPACQKSSHWAHPDLHFSFPVVGTKKTSNDMLPQWREALSEGPYFRPSDWFERCGEGGKQGNINVAEIQQIVQKLAYTRVEGRYKILLLWGAEFLGKEGNRLLKLIEEPPEQTLFFLIGTDADRVLPTILSRCQLIKVRPFRDAEIAEALQAQQVASHQEADLWAYLADGNLGEAQRLAAAVERSDADEPSMEQYFLIWLRSWFRPDLAACQLVDRLAAKTREEQKVFFQYGLHFVRQMVFADQGLDEHLRLPPTEKTAARKLASLLDMDRLDDLAELLGAGMRAIERNAHAKLLFLNASIRVHHLLRNDVHRPAKMIG